MNASVVGFGTWLPAAVRTNDAWPERFVKRSHEVGDRTFNDIPPSDDPAAAAIVDAHLAAEAHDPFLGSKRRHIADASTSAAEAEANAALVALSRANIDPRDVDLVLSYSIVADRILPTGPDVANRIGARTSRALGVDTACASSVSQLEVARAYVESGLAKVVLLVQSHLLLRTMPLEHPATPGLGDGATALVVTRGPGLAIRATFTHSHGEFANAVTWVRDVDQGTENPWWKSGGDFRPGTRAPSQVKALMRDTVTYGARTMREAASLANIDVERVSVLASVQPRGFLPGAIAQQAGLASDRAVTTYERIAHVGACGPVFNLDEAHTQGRLTKGALVALYGQGAGFTRSAAILEQTA